VLARILTALLIGGLVGAAIVYLALRNHPSWQEQEARSEASALSCNMESGVGLHCVKIASFEKTSPGSWQVRLALNRNHSVCYLLRTERPPHQQPCLTGE
jgi:hypothetical protein